MSELCCTISPALICEACGLQMCNTCLNLDIRQANEASARDEGPVEDISTLYHERGQCSKGANHFRRSVEGGYLFSKREWS